MKYLVCFLSFAISSISFTQGADVVIDAKGKREVEPSSRMTENPQMIDTTIATKVLDYPYLVLQHPTSIQLDTIKPATIKTEPKLVPLYHSYAKIGVGTELMPIGEFYFNSTRDRKYLYGIHLKHLSSYGNFDSYAPAQFDRNNASAYGGILTSKYSLTSKAWFQSNGFNYYGFEANPDTIDRKTIAQRFQEIGGTMRYDLHKKDSAKLNFSVQLDYLNFRSMKPLTDSLSAWRGMENQIGLFTKGTYRSGKEVYSVDFGFRYNGYRYGVKGDTLGQLADSGIVLDNGIFNLKPMIHTTSLDNKFSAKIGLDFVVDFHKTNRVHLYPVAEIKYSLLHDMFIPYLGINGSLKQTTLHGLSANNEFMLTNISLRNEHTAYNLYGGFKGTLSKTISFNVTASYASIQDKAFFVTDTLLSIGNKFSVIYDSLSKMSVEGSLSFQKREKLKIDVIGRFHSYSMLNNTYAWNLPQWEAIARGHYNLFDKFTVNLDLTMEGGRYALQYAPGKNVTFKNDQYFTALGLIADANLGIEYRYNKRISAFIQCNNLASQRYARWYGYPVQIFQFMGGITARF